MPVLLSDEEIAAMEGLPHLHKCLYIFGIRRYMDYATGITGVKRGISWQSLKEELFIEPRSGISEKSPSKDQIRRAAKWLERAGVITIKSDSERLIFECVLAKQDKSVQKQAATKPPPHPAMAKANKNKALRAQAAMGVSAQAATPPLSGNKSTNVDLSIYQSFDNFWATYPRKVNKKKSLELWISKQCSSHIEAILDDIEQRKKGDVNWREGNQYVPHPVTYMNQERWTDEEKCPKPAQQTGATMRSNDYADDKRALQQRRAEIGREFEQEYLDSLIRRD